MKVLIVEDEIYSYNDLRDMLSELYPDIEVEGPITNLTDLSETLKNQADYDIIYSDISLEDGVCFSVYEHIELTAPVIFTTAYDDYALKAFDSNGIAYLLKPIMPDALKKATSKALQYMEGDKQKGLQQLLSSLHLKDTHTYSHHLKATAYDGSYIISVNDISHFKLEGKHVNAMMNNGTSHRIEYTLDKIMEKLDPILFFRANRQYIINRNSIKRIRTWDNRKKVIELHNYPDVNILVSKESVGRLEKWIEE